MSNSAHIAMEPPADAEGVGNDPADNPLDAAVDTWKALEQRATHLLQLVTAELRLAASSGAWMGILTIVAGGMILVSWIALQATAGAIAFAAGIQFWVISLSLAVLNLVFAALAAWLIIRLSRYITLPHLRAARKAAAAIEEMQS